MTFLHNFGSMLFAFAVVIGPAIFFHELGHFYFAKKFGVKVYTFSLGFGPKLWSMTRGGTEYQLAAIPFGGYVKMAGEDPAEPRDGSPDEFGSKPVWQRAIIIAAGPAANIILGFFICIFIYLVGVDPDYIPRIGQIPPSNVSIPGAEVGDVIVSINGSPVKTWADIARFERPAMGKSLKIVVRRPRSHDAEGEQIELSGVPMPISYPQDPDWYTRVQIRSEIYFLGGNGTLGLVPWVDPVIGGVKDAGAAMAAGLKPGDRIVSIGDKPVAQWMDVADAIRSSTVGVPFMVKVIRPGQTLTQTLTVPVTPKVAYVMSSDGTPAQNADGTLVTYSAIGISQVVMTGAPRGFLHSIVSAGFMTIKLGKMVVVILKKLLSGQVSAKLMAGPLGIAQMSGNTFKEGGVMALVYLLAFISVNLGVANLLPIPLMDGGWLFIFLLYESLVKKPMSPKVQERLIQAGAAALIALILLVTFNDIKRLFGFETVEDVLAEKHK